MAPANVANVALLREASQHVEVMNVTGRNSKLPSELGGKGLILFFCKQLGRWAVFFWDLIFFHHGNS